MIGTWIKDIKSIYFLSSFSFFFRYYHAIRKPYMCTLFDLISAHAPISLQWKFLINAPFSRLHLIIVFKSFYWRRIFYEEGHIHYWKKTQYFQLKHFIISIFCEWNGAHLCRLSFILPYIDFISCFSNKCILFSNSKGLGHLLGRIR